MILDIVKDVLIDTLKLLPFLFLTYLLMEYLEHNALSKFAAAIKKVGRFGPLIGAALGVIPQCGFSAVAAGLYAGGVVTEGTLISIFLSTSDEMLPLLISHGADADRIALILVAKFALAAISGFVIDGILRVRKHNRIKGIHDFCEQENCRCEDGIWTSALRHTIKIWLFVLVVSFGLQLLLNVVGFENVSAFLNNGSPLVVLIAALIGLIPNCAASVVLTECYLGGVLGTGAMMAGLLVSAGMGLLVLFRSNHNQKENIRLTATLLVCGVLWGLLINAFWA